MYEDMLDAILDALLPTVVHRGPLPPTDNSISAYFGPGAPSAEYLSRGSFNDVTLVVNSKNSDQRAGVSALSSIHKRLTRLGDYPEGTSDGLVWEITHIKTNVSPNPLGMDDSNMYLHGSTLEVQFYVKGV